MQSYETDRYKQKQIYTNTHDNKIQCIIRHMKYIYIIIMMSTLICLKTCKYTIKAQ